MSASKQILAIGASNRKGSINKVFANYIAHQLSGVNVSLLNWEKLELPVYNQDIEDEKGFPKSVYVFIDQIDRADAIIISLAENNGLPTAAFKSLCDWTSRVDRKFFANKPVFLASTAPGGRGGKGALEAGEKLIPILGGDVKVVYSLPFFQDNFTENGINDEELNSELTDKINLFQKIVSEL